MIIGSLLFGLERSAPLKKDLFGGTHSPNSVSKDLSALGKRKWRDYRPCGQPVPADVGGMRVNINRDGLNDLVEVFSNVSLCKPTDGYVSGDLQRAERRLFGEILQASTEEANAAIERHIVNCRRGAFTVMQMLVTDGLFFPARASKTDSSASRVASHINSGVGQPKASQINSNASRAAPPIDSGDEDLTL